MQKKLQNKNKNKKGFSLVEVLFSLLVLSAGLAGIVMMMTKSMQASLAAKDQMIASQLAQEGIELVRNLNDNRALVDGTSYSNYRIEKSSGVINFLDAVSGPSKQLYLFSDANSEYYTHVAGTNRATKFYRKIDVDGSVANQRTVVSMVTWNNTGVFPGVCNIGNQCLSTTAVFIKQ